MLDVFPFAVLLLDEKASAWVSFPLNILAAVGLEQLLEYS